MTVTAFIHPTHNQKLPIILRVEGDSFGLTQAEAEELVEALDVALEQVENAGFVQVESIGGTTMRYTYRDPSNSLQVGDLVEAPTRNGTMFAKVAALGRGSSVCSRIHLGDVKAVASKLTRELIREEL